MSFTFLRIYTFLNNTGGTLTDVSFLSFIDAEIDEPGYVYGDIYNNLLLGALDNMNNVSGSSPDDVSMALGFNLGNLDPLSMVTLRILLSENGNIIGPLALSQYDTDPDSTTVITISGQSVLTPVPVPIPEPSSFLLMIAGFITSFVVRRYNAHHVM